MTLISTASRFESVLVVGAHPDDEVLGCGGTIARLSQEGASVHIALMADGIRARHLTYVEGDIQDELARRREGARVSAAILGAQSVEFNDFPDNRLDSVDLLDLVRAVEALIARHRPSIVLTHFGSDLNVDHRRVHEAVVTACRPQPGQPVNTVLFFETASNTEWQMPSRGEIFAPTWFIDITSHVQTKRAALEAYATEMRSWPHARSYESLEHLGRWRGATIGVQAAEAFVLGRHLMIESTSRSLLPIGTVLEK